MNPMSMLSSSPQVSTVGTMSSPQDPRQPTPHAGGGMPGGMPLAGQSSSPYVNVLSSTTTHVMGNTNMNMNMNNNAAIDPKHAHLIPPGVNMPSSMDPNVLFTSDRAVQLIQKLTPNQMQAALDEYADAMKQKGGKVRNPTAYLVGVIKRYVTVNSKERKSGASSMGEDVTPVVKVTLQKLIDNGFCTQNDLGEKVMSKLKMLSEHDALLAINELSSVPRETIRNFPAYFMGLLNRYMRGDGTPSQHRSKTGGGVTGLNLSSHHNSQNNNKRDRYNEDRYNKGRRGSRRDSDDRYDRDRHSRGRDRSRSIDSYDDDRRYRRRDRDRRSSRRDHSDDSRSPSSDRDYRSSRRSRRDRSHSRSRSRSRSRERYGVGDGANHYGGGNSSNRDHRYNGGGSSRDGRRSGRSRSRSSSPGYNRSSRRDRDHRRGSGSSSRHSSRSNSGPTNAAPHMQPQQMHHQHPPPPMTAMQYPNAPPGALGSIPPPPPPPPRKQALDPRAIAPPAPQQQQQQQHHWQQPQPNLQFQQQSAAAASLAPGYNNLIGSTASAVGVPGYTMANTSQFGTSIGGTPLVATTTHPPTNYISSATSQITGASNALDILGIAEKAASAVQALQQQQQRSTPAPAPPQRTDPRLGFQQQNIGRMSNPPPSISSSRPNMHEEDNVKLEDLSPMIQYSIQNLQATGHLDKSLGVTACRYLKNMTEPTALQDLERFSSCDSNQMRSKEGYLVGVLKKASNGVPF